MDKYGIFPSLTPLSMQEYEELFQRIFATQHLDTDEKRTAMELLDVEVARYINDPADATRKTELQTKIFEAMCDYGPVLTLSPIEGAMNLYRRGLLTLRAL